MVGVSSCRTAVGRNAARQTLSARPEQARPVAELCRPFVFCSLAALEWTRRICLRASVALARRNGLPFTAQRILTNYSQFHIRKPAERADSGWRHAEGSALSARQGQRMSVGCINRPDRSSLPAYTSTANQPLSQPTRKANLDLHADMHTEAGALEKVPCEYQDNRIGFRQAEEESGSRCSLIARQSSASHQLN